MNKIVPGAIFKHYTNKLYLIDNIAIDSKTLDRMVIYRSLYPCDTLKFKKCQLWTRPEQSFMQVIHTDKKTIQRFEFVEFS